MRLIRALLALAFASLSLASCGKADDPPVDLLADNSDAELAAAAETVIIGTKDGHKIFADHVPVAHARATIVLFHQAGSSAYEYREIAHRLNQWGYSTLAVDQRSGGPLFGPNRTVSKYGKSDEDYLAALPDMVAALNWARLQGAPVILLGSSYSASLALRVAADNPKLVAAVMAFSPGEYFPDKHYAHEAAKRIKIPVFITQATTPDEQAASEMIFQAVPDPRKTLFIPRGHGVHGASTLRDDRNAQGSAENWQAVRDFLTGLNLQPTHMAPPARAG